MQMQPSASPRFQHILVPVDFTEKNAASLDIAFEMAVERQARLTLLHVIETVEQAEDREIEDFYKMLQERARTKLDEIAARFIREGLIIDGEIVFGRRVQEIVRYSVDHEIDLIVLSSHKIDLEHPAGSYGTLSHQVSILCQCPALLVK